MQNNQSLKAQVIGRDVKTDIAVLRVESKTPLPFVELGNSDKMRVGDWVVAIGNPFGLGGTVTAGIISARGRNINSGPYDDFIQTDASINRGNSGGPLFNMKGEVIGINTAIFSPSGGSIGIGFAIPTTIAENVINQLVKYGKTKRGWLGVRIQTVTEEIAESLGLNSPEGALVASITDNSPAARGGIKPGDVILKFDGKIVKEMRNLPKIVAETEIGAKTKVEIWRNRKRKVEQIQVGELDEEVATTKTSIKKADKSKSGIVKIEPIGLSVSNISESLRKQFKLKTAAKGVVIVNVETGGIAEKKGIKPGDRIIEASQSQINTPADLLKQLTVSKKAGRKSLLLLIEGSAGLRFVALRYTVK